MFLGSSCCNIAENSTFARPLDFACRFCKATGLCMQIKPKFPRFCGSVRYRNAGHTLIFTVIVPNFVKHEPILLKLAQLAKKAEPTFVRNSILR